MNSNFQEQNRIKILPEYIANQIAAGEVVQRPESVVKELVENSLDAGADTIAVVIHNGGKKLVHIVDNGCGMGKEDLLLSIRRHATSKIITAEDLEEIKTYGFRGEALASIAAVSQLEIRSKTSNSDLGWKLLAEPNKEPTIEPISMDVGTQIFVKHLFYNVPARKKFLKSDLTEFRYISDTLLKIALRRNDVRFVFYDEDSLVFDVHKSTTEERIKVLLGDLIYDSILKVDFEYQGVKIWGYIGQPHLAKTSRGGQYLYLNGRSIKSRALTYAVFLAYEHLLEKQTSPFFFLNIELDPKMFDVNVHPQKQEVKFEDDKFIFNLINNAVNKTLTENNLAPSIAVSSSLEPFRKVEIREEGQPQSVQLVNRMTGEVIDEKFQFGSKIEHHNRFNSDFRGKLNYLPPQKGGNASDYSSLFLKRTFNEDTELKSWKNILQVHNKYIIVEKNDGMLLVDQHAAHERILYEKAAKSLETNTANSQQTLFPLVIQFNPVEFAAIKEIRSEFEKIGFRFEIHSNGEVEIFAVPSDIVNREEENIIREIVSMYVETSKVNQSARRDNLLASYSCKAAIKTGQKLTNEEMESLLLELFNCSIPYACPHGRPVLIELTLEELDKNFCRIL